MQKVLASVVLAAIGFCSFTSAAMACPKLTTGLETVTHTASELYTPLEIDVVAGGSVNLAECSDVPGTGYVIEEPDFSLMYQRDAKYDLEFRTAGSCDTILLINDSSGAYYHDDDNGDDSNALIRLAGAGDGRYDIWVGTFDPETCDVQLVLETF